VAYHPITEMLMVIKINQLVVWICSNIGFLFVKVIHFCSSFIETILGLLVEVPILSLLLKSRM
jgi:hypothetical protein